MNGNCRLRNIASAIAESLYQGVSKYASGLSGVKVASRGSKERRPVGAVLGSQFSVPIPTFIRYPLARDIGNVAPDSVVLQNEGCRIASTDSPDGAI